MCFLLRCGFPSVPSLLIHARQVEQIAILYEYGGRHAEDTDKLTS